MEFPRDCANCRFFYDCNSAMGERNCLFYNSEPSKSFIHSVENLLNKIFH